MKEQEHIFKNDALSSVKFGRNEFAFMGAPCPVIQQLSLRIISDLSGTYKIAYADADHRSGTVPFNTNKDVMNSGGMFELTNKLDYFQLHLRKELNSYDCRSFLNDADLALVNGNHFEASRQILILDPVKFDSLSRHSEKLTEVVLVLTTEKTAELPLFLKEKLPYHQDIPLLSITDTDGIAAFISNKMSESLPKIQGLILTGGKSLRMGTDKSLLPYNGVSQRERAGQLFKTLNIPVYYSCREDQKVTFSDPDMVITDSFLDLGPMGGILSAFRSNPGVAWLSIASDMPLLSQATLEFLLRNRRSSAIATAFLNGTTKSPEPLLTIWEPKSYQVLLNFLGQGISSPKEVLLNSDTHFIAVPDEMELKNVNHPEAYQEVSDLLSSRKNES